MMRRDEMRWFERVNSCLKVEVILSCVRGEIHGVVLGHRLGD